MVRHLGCLSLFAGLGLLGVRQLAWMLTSSGEGRARAQRSVGSPIQRSATSAQMLPALSEQEDYSGKVYRVRSDTDMKGLADHVVREAEQGLFCDSLGIRAASVVVKACATAMTLDFNGQIVAMALDWVTKKPHGRAFREGAMEVTALRTNYQLVEKRAEPPKQSPLLVGRTTNIGQLGGAILGRIQQSGEALIHVAGPERTMAALRSIIAADRLWSVDDKNTPEEARPPGPTLRHCPLQKRALPLSVSRSLSLPLPPSLCLSVSLSLSLSLSLCLRVSQPRPAPPAAGSWCQRPGKAMLRARRT